MKKTKITYFNRIAPILLLCPCLVINAQKLPNVQTVGVRAPVNAKTDGKATEWNNHFQAHNAAADVLYTIANDDENLYLVVQAKDVNVINTIVGYGFEFGIQKSGRKDDKGKISIIYPVVSTKSAPIRFGRFMPNGNNALLTDTSAAIANTVMNNANKVLDQKLKSIIVTGIKNFDTLSVYNEDDIKAAGRFDNKMVYTFEISVALKYIGLEADSASKFAYHMIFNGYSQPEDLHVNIPPNSSQETIAQIQQGTVEMNTKFSKRYPHTDFWGEYTLAKKP